MATTEERFNAAVNVIRNLPKNGSYQPSNAMMLTFYAYFKQATEGPCKQTKPNFWDVVGRAKWDAWKALGEMSRDRAMHLYVDELKKIIETMSYTENVANFMGSISELDNVNIEDLEAVAPEIMKKARSHPNSPFASRASSPQHSPPTTNGYANGAPAGASDRRSYLHQNGYTAEQSDDEYIDTVESRSDSIFDGTRGEHIPPILQQILGTVQRMNADVTSVNQRIASLEKHLLELKIQVSKKRS